jgi:geranylgeranyl reductase family protein
MFECDVIVVGAGPAGTATAIALTNCSPAWASRIVMLDKAQFPRPKLCGGGITHAAATALAQLKVAVNVESVVVDTAALVFPQRTLVLRRKPLFHVVRRDDFDAALLDVVVQRGISVHQGQRVMAVAVDADGVTVRTDSAVYRGTVVVGADGAHSTVRRCLGLGGNEHLMPALEVWTPLSEQEVRERCNRRAVFDFSLIADGVSGYYWDFPSSRDGTPGIVRGIMDSRLRAGPSGRSLKQALALRLQARNLDLQYLALQGHPLRCFDARAHHSAARVVLVGDAAGVEPLFGEGIPSALEHGLFAARAINGAFATEDFSFATYDRALFRSHLGRSLRIKALAAHHFYAANARWQYIIGAWTWCYLDRRVETMLSLAQGRERRLHGRRPDRGG